MASEIRVDKITSLSGVGTITPSPTGIDIAGITTVATLKATTGIVTTLTATTGIVTTLTTNTLTANSTTKVGSGVTLSPDGDIFATGVTTSTTFVGNLTGNVTGNVTGTASGNPTLSSGADNRIITASSSSAIQGESGLTYDGDTLTNDAVTRNIQAGYNYVLIGSSDANGVSIAFDGDSNGDGAGVDYAFIEHNTSGDLNIVGDNPANASNIRFKTNSTTERVRITSTGDVKIGDNAVASGALRYLDVQNSDSSSASSGAIIRLISSNQAQNSTTSVDLAKYRDGAFYINNNETHSGATTVFQVGGSEIARFTTSGLAIGGTGDANTLEDYEEGTYTPTNHAGTATFTNNTTARYRKIGQMVYVQYDISISSSDSSTNAGMTMPFASSIAYGSGVAGWTTLGRPAFMHISGAYAYFMDNSTSGSSSQHLVFNETNGHRFIGSFWYIHTG